MGRNSSALVSSDGLSGGPVMPSHHQYYESILQATALVVLCTKHGLCCCLRLSVSAETVSAVEA